MQERLEESDFDEWPNKYGTIKGPILLHNIIQSYSSDTVKINAGDANCSITTDSIFISVNLYNNCYDAQRMFFCHKAFNMAHFYSTTNDSLYGDVCEYYNYGDRIRIVMVKNNHGYNLLTELDSVTVDQIMDDIESAVDNNPTLDNLNASLTRPIVEEVILPDTLFRNWVLPRGFEVKVLFQNQDEILSTIIRLTCDTFEESRRVRHAENDTFRLGDYGYQYGTLQGDLSGVQEATLWIIATNKRGESCDTTITLTP
ncbi:MAG: hypothetical protein RAP03_04770 [Candidatus Electryonea clarkiae]|nr:hypothetical protein [Candidatus Electryonea clarkiae]